MATVYEGGLDGACGLLAVDPPSLLLQRRDEQGEGSAPEELERVGSLEMTL